MQFYLSDFQGYIKTLCTLHVMVQHSDTDNVAFVPFQSEEDLNQVANQGAANLVLINRWYGKPSGPSADELTLKQFTEIRFACAAIPDVQSNYSDLVSDATSRAFLLLLDFLARFKEDMLTDCGPLAGLELENASWAEIPEQPFLNAMYGFDLTLSFKTDFPNYNQNRWAAAQYHGH